jgi:translocation and assembly module TamB
MSRPKKLILWLISTCLAALVVFAGAALYVIQSGWFKEQIREKLISTVEYATGGRVELKAFQYDWRRLTAEADGFVLRGTEPAGGPPLLSADSIKIQLKILSALHQDIDISTLVVNRPQVYLLIREDGSTNVPEPKIKRTTNPKPALEQLLDLKVKHFEVNQGVVEVNLKQAPLDIRGDNLQAELSYEQLTAPHYLLKASSQQLQLKTTNLETIAGDLAIDASIERDQIAFSQVTYRLPKSKVEAHGTLVHLESPTVAFQANAEIDVAEAAKIVDLPQLRSGVLTFQGEVRYGSPGFVLSGNVEGTRLSYRDRNLAVSPVSLKSALTLTKNQVTLQGLSMSALGASFSGRADLRDYKTFELDGKVSRLDTARVGPLLVGRPLPWHGAASGAVRLQASLGKRSNVTLQSELTIEPGTLGIPVSGHVGLAFESRSGSLQLKQTVLQFPHSQLEVSGTVGEQLQVTLDTTSLDDLQPALALASSDAKPAELPLQLLQGGHARFAGTVARQLNHPTVEGDLELDHFRTESETIDRLRSRLKASADQVSVASLTADQGPLHVSVSGSLGLMNWTAGKSSALKVNGQVKNLDLAAVAKTAGQQVPNLAGKADATFQLSGTLGAPQGTARVEASELGAFDEHINRATLDAALSGNRLQVTKGQLREGGAIVAFSGDYTHTPDEWKSGTLHLRSSTTGFALSEVGTIRKQDPDLRGRLEFNAQVDASIKNGQWLIQNVEGKAALRNVSLAKVDYGSITVDTRTSGGQTQSAIRADLRDSQVQGNLRLGLSSDYPITGSLEVQKITFATLNALTQPNPKALPFEGFVQGNLAFSGSLRKLDQIRGRATVASLEVDPLIPAHSRGGLKPEDLVLKNSEPIVVDYENGEAHVRSAHFTARDTSLTIAGKVPLLVKDALDVSVEGSVNLQVFQLFDPNVVSSGLSTLKVNVTGPIADPSVTGTLELKNAAFHLEDFSNGLERANGVIRFDRNRATIQTLTAQTGGGSLSLGGFVTFGGGGPLVYRLEGKATNVRVRYASAVSVTSDASVRFTGTSESSLLSGNITVTRASFDASADIGALFAATTAPAASPSSDSDLLHGLQLDVHLESAPSLQLSTSLSQDVQAEIDLHLRGSPSRPSVLGRISVNEGQIQVFGNKYTINRGEISFFNPAKIEPVLDVDLETQARGITVTITISGTGNKLNVNYRSDPALAPSDIIALLAVGRTPETALSNLATSQITTGSNAFASGANTVLGQALSPVSNRLQKLFGVTHIKIDPFSQGLDNSTQARLTLEQQISKEITITYITNLAHTTEQVFRFEWTLSKQYSLVGLYNENGVLSVNLQYKKRFK